MDLVLAIGSRQKPSHFRRAVGSCPCLKLTVVHQANGEILTTGEVPSTAELRELLQWVDSQYTDAPFSCSSVAKANPDLDTLTPMASGVLAIKLGATYYLSKPADADDIVAAFQRGEIARWGELVRSARITAD